MLLQYKNSMKKSFYVQFFLVLIYLVCITVSLSSFAGEQAIKKLGVKELALTRVELAKTPEQKATGLMFRETLCSGCVMLFIYDEPTNGSFWMKNTYVSLDIIFMDKAGKIVTIQENTKPLDFSILYASSVPYVYVLEAGSGFAKKHNLTLGVQIDIDELLKAV